MSVQDNFGSILSSRTVQRFAFGANVHSKIIWKNKNKNLFKITKCHFRTLVISPLFECEILTLGIEESCHGIKKKIKKYVSIGFYPSGLCLGKSSLNVLINS